MQGAAGRHSPYEDRHNSRSADTSGNPRRGLPQGMIPPSCGADATAPEPSCPSPTILRRPSPRRPSARCGPTSSSRSPTSGSPPGRRPCRRSTSPRAGPGSRRCSPTPPTRRWSSSATARRRVSPLSKAPCCTSSSCRARRQRVAAPPRALDRRGQGVWRCGGLALEVNQDNPRAVRFYLREGFRQDRRGPQRRLRPRHLAHAVAVTRLNGGASSWRRHRTGHTAVHRRRSWPCRPF